MSERTLSRMRVVFDVGEPLKYISHLDLFRAWERTLRRALVPLAYSQGFNPHPRLVIALPLPVGCTGAREVIDVFLDEPLTPDRLLELLGPALPAGVGIVSAQEVPVRDPALPTLISGMDYRLTLEGVSLEEVQQRAVDLLACDTRPITFRGKTFDLRSLVGALAASSHGQAVVLEASLLRLASGKLGRPDALLEALGLAEHARSVHRARIVYEAT